MNTVDAFPDIVSLLCGVEKTSPGIYALEEGKARERQIAWVFITKTLLEIDNSHTDLILVTAFCGCKPSQAPSLPFAFILLCFSLGTILSPPLPLSSLLFQLQAYLEHVCFHAFSFHSQSLPPSHFLLPFPSSLTLVCVFCTSIDGCEARITSGKLNEAA